MGDELAGVLVCCIVPGAGPVLYLWCEDPEVEQVCARVRGGRIRRKVYPVSQRQNGARTCILQCYNNYHDRNMDHLTSTYTAPRCRALHHTSPTVARCGHIKISEVVQHVEASEVHLNHFDNTHLHGMQYPREVNTHARA